MVKITYGMGLSIMMNTGDKPVISAYGMVAPLAWDMDGRMNYALEGNINAPEDRGLVIHEVRIDCAPEKLGQARGYNFYCGVMDPYPEPGA